MYRNTTSSPQFQYNISYHIVLIQSSRLGETMKVSGAVGHQFPRSSDLNDPPFLHHTNSENQNNSVRLSCPDCPLLWPVTGEDGVEPVGDGDDGAAGELALYEARHLLVRHHVHGGGGLVQYQQFGVPVNINIRNILLLSPYNSSVVGSKEKHIISQCYWFWKVNT